MLQIPRKQIDKTFLRYYIEGNNTAKKLYESFGFVESHRDENEIIMKKLL